MPSRGTCHILVSILVLCAVAMPAVSADLYRVELLLFERLNGHPEQLPDPHKPAPLPDNGVPLWVSDDSPHHSTLPKGATLGEASGAAQLIPQVRQIQSLPRNALRLGNIAWALENDANYRLLALTGWKDAFPDGYKGPPLLVDLASAKDNGERIQGTLRIERQRYLHVKAALHDTQRREPALDVAPIPRRPIASGLILPLPRYLPPESPAFSETITLLRENRRMRSEEVHYLDAPTFGLVVYFDPVTNKDTKEKDKQKEQQDEEEASS
ncbi:CsiV family protein [Halomonadaceae bacterium KBTZ08]